MHLHSGSFFQPAVLVHQSVACNMYLWGWTIFHWTMVVLQFHQKLYGTLPTDRVQQVAIKLLDTQVFAGSVQERSSWRFSWIQKMSDSKIQCTGTWSNPNDLPRNRDWIPRKVIGSLGRWGWTIFQWKNGRYMVVLVPFQCICLVTSQAAEIYTNSLGAEEKLGWIVLDGV